MKKIRNGAFINLRYFSIIFVIAFGLLTVIGCSSSDDEAAPVVPVVPIDNSSFYGDYAISMTFDSCALEFETITIGGDLNRKDEENYIYIPQNQSSNTYTRVYHSGDRTITTEISGETVTYDEVGPDFEFHGTFVFSPNYNNFDINGEDIEDDPADCDGTVTGSGIRVGTVGVEIGYNYLQYRTPYNQYRGWLDVYKDGIPPEAADIKQVELKDSNDNIVDITVSDLLSTPVYYGRWNSQTSIVDFSGPSFYSGYGIGFPGGFELPADDYTWEVTTSEDVVVPKPISYPGKKELPFVDSASMTSEWQDGSLTLSWVNPPNIAPGDYEELFIILNSDVGHMLYAYVPADKNELTIPSDWVDSLGKYFEPTTVNWRIMTRSFTPEPEGMNHARGFSNSVPIPGFGGGVIDNSPFWGDFAVSTTTDSCDSDTSIKTMGGDSTRKDERDYVYIPKDQNSITYTSGDDIITIDINGLTVNLTVNSIGFVDEMKLVYSNDYNNFTINGEKFEDNPDRCDGIITGSGIRVGSVGVTIGYNYLQYRTPTGQYRGYVELTKDGIPVVPADINKIELKDSNGDPVILDPVNPVVNYSPTTYYYGMWNPATSSVDFSGPASYAGFGVGFPGGFNLPADDYTWEVITSDGKLVSATINYPGQKVLPVVDIATMQSVWQPDGLQFSWTNPPNIAPGDYDQLRVVSRDDNSEMLYVRLPSNVDEFIIPIEMMVIFDKFYSPTTNARWQVQPRSHTAEGMNYARGISKSVLIPAPPGT